MSIEDVCGFIDSFFKEKYLIIIFITLLVVLKK